MLPLPLHAYIKGEQSDSDEGSKLVLSSTETYQLFANCSAIRNPTVPSHELSFKKIPSIGSSIGRRTYTEYISDKKSMIRVISPIERDPKKLRLADVSKDDWLKEFRAELTESNARPKMEIGVELMIYADEAKHCFQAELNVEREILGG
ncbi:hypothetical protein HD806DRAFT_541725 [Xylariaceae sp. AK1471]|nr:hypothetical protein HD806DRAFT_541725 [Xylariaceae sp. AK1471]